LRVADEETYQPWAPLVRQRCGLADVARSTLFGISRAPRRLKFITIFNDQRWRGEASLRRCLLSPSRPAASAWACWPWPVWLPRRFEASHLQYVSTIATVAGIAMGNALHFEGIQP